MRNNGYLKILDRVRVVVESNEYLEGFISTVTSSLSSMILYIQLLFNEL